MTKWYVKDLSKLTGVSVQTLHHYDRIDLLKPSIRMPNGYRVYSEKDLLRLQQIVALKYFGFELSQIKALLINERDAIEHFSEQAQFLEQKAKALQDASKVLRSVISDVKDDKSISWKTIIQLIEVYRMTQQLEHSWVKEIFTPEELKQYAAFEAEMKAGSVPKEVFEQAWFDLVDKIKDHIDEDPTSPIGIELGGKCMALVNKIYGKKYAHLRTIKFEKGFKSGKGLEEIGMNSEDIAWLEVAISSYWKDRIYTILDQVGKNSSPEILKTWDDLLDDMVGDNLDRRKEIREAALKDDRVSARAKEWLRGL